MEHTTSLILISVAALVHASFQLSISVLTLLSSHTIGAKRSHKHLLRLSTAYTTGVAVMTLLLLSASAYVAQQFYGDAIPRLLWVTLCGLLFGLGVSVWLFYYRKEKGTSLWVPRPMARYLHDRTKATKQGVEAFSLGMSSVVGELLFVVAPLLVSAFVLISLPSLWQLVGIALYGFISLLPLGIVTMLIGGGHSISRIQKWREENKLFLQFIAGSTLLVLAFYLYVDQVLSPAVFAAAGAV